MARKHKKNPRPTYRLPHQDLLTPPTAGGWEAGTLDLLSKTIRLTNLRGKPLPLPPQDKSLLTLPNGLYTHLHRVYLWTIATGTPGYIPGFYAYAPALKAGELVEAGAAYKSDDGDIFLAGFHSMETQANVTVVEDPAELAPFIPNSQKEETNG